MINKFLGIKRKSLFFSIFFALIFYLFMVKFLPFNFLKNNLDGQKILNKEKYTMDEILNYEIKISKKLNIQQCLIRMSALFYVLKQNSYNPKLFIGVKETKSFKSHAWLYVEKKFIDLEDRNEYKTILEIS